MVVVGSNRANSRAFVHSMSRVEETEKESSPRARIETETDPEDENLLG